jgi:hypothetical protein
VELLENALEAARLIEEVIRRLLEENLEDNMVDGIILMISVGPHNLLKRKVVMDGLLIIDLN